MVGPPPTRPRRYRRTAWLAIAGALLLVGTGSLVAGLHRSHRPLTGPAAVLPTTTSPTTAPPAIPAVTRSVPVSLQIPAIGVSAPVGELGLNADGTVQVPADVHEPGWFEPGVSPGQVGSAVILGHVDSYLGPAVFFDLRSLQAGDPVEVTLADGVVVHFVVRSVVMYAKSQFPDAEVYASHGYPALQLVTCGGAFDSETGHYLSNVVVYTSFVGAI